MTEIKTHINEAGRCNENNGAIVKNNARIQTFRKVHHEKKHFK